MSLDKIETVSIGNRSSEIKDHSLVIGFSPSNKDYKDKYILLNHKIDSAAYKSTSEFTFKNYYKKSHEEVKHIYVEDFSLDTCFAYIIFNMEGNNNDSQKVKIANDKKIELWVNYISNYEQGYILLDESIDKSLAVSFTAVMLAKLREANIKKSFLECIDSLIKCFEENDSPLNIELNKYFPLASLYISHEKMCAEHDLKIGTKLQLLSPFGVEDGSSELTIIDALFTLEHYDSSAKKHLFRSTAQSWTKRGFWLWFVIRNVGKMTYTISAPGNAGIAFKKLYLSLEVLETKKYSNDSRPKDDPRDGGYTYNDPWWDDSHTYTLVESPKCGSMLTEEEVKEEIWRVHFLSYISKCVKSIKGYAKIFNITNVDQEPKIPDLFLESPTFEKYLLCQAEEKCIAKLPPTEIKSNKSHEIYEVKLNDILSINEFVSIHKNHIKYVISKKMFAVFVFYKDYKFCANPLVETENEIYDIYHALEYIVCEFENKVNECIKRIHLNESENIKSIEMLESILNDCENIIKLITSDMRKHQNTISVNLGVENANKIFHVVCINQILSYANHQISDLKSELDRRTISENRNRNIFVSAIVAAASIALVCSSMVALYVDTKTSNVFEYLNTYGNKTNPALTEMAATVSQWQFFQLLIVTIIFIIAIICGVVFYRHKSKYN